MAAGTFFHLRRHSHAPVPSREVRREPSLLERQPDNPSPALRGLLIAMLLAAPFWLVVYLLLRYLR